jgi:hypothetical protein
MPRTLVRSRRKSIAKNCAPAYRKRWAKAASARVKPVSPRLDWPGLVPVIAALALTLQGLAHGHREGWDIPARS